MSNPVTEQAETRPETDAPEQMRVRIGKLAAMRERGIEPYPVQPPRTHEIGAVRTEFGSLGPDQSTGVTVSVAGRVMLNRIGGKLCFATIRDVSGEIQVMVSLAGVGAESLAAWKTDVDLGDHVSVTGEVITSKRGELSVLAASWMITSKCLRPLPDKHKGLVDPETRVRQRYVDLIVNPDTRAMAIRRAKAVADVRQYLTERGFIEVETPMLQQLHGGANARPFITHSNAYNLPLYLRIAPELYLKRLVVGGLERVFELNRVFRNEGSDSSHNPEFTMLEAYEAYGTYDSMAVLTRELIQSAARAVYGSTVVQHPDCEYDLGGIWKEQTVYGAVSEKLGEQVTPDTGIDSLRQIAAKAGIELKPDWHEGEIILEFYEHLVERTTVEPTFYRDFPKSVSPLTRAHRDDPRLAERWDLVAFGTEIGTAYSELVDPVDQRERLTEQSLRAAGGDPEAMQLDEDFLRALEFGMPPSGGMGMGIERLLMLLTGMGIRETLLFPLVKTPLTK